VRIDTASQRIGKDGKCLVKRVQCVWRQLLSRVRCLDKEMNYCSDDV